MKEDFYGAVPAEEAYFYQRYSGSSAELQNWNNTFMQELILRASRGDPFEVDGFPTIR